MRNEIERKFLVKTMPDLSQITPKKYERYFLSIGDGAEERIQKIDNKYFFQRKTEISKIERSRDKKREITETEFNNLRQKALNIQPIYRQRFDISFNPDISIQVYKGKFEGLVRAEVEFDSKEEAEVFIPLSWMGEEITNLPIARDSKLINLTEEEFSQIISRSH